MAAVTLLGGTFNTSAGVKTATLTPAVGDLIVIAISHTGDSSWSNPTDNNSDGLGTYTIIGSITSNVNDGISAIGLYVRDAAIGSASSTVFTAPSPAADTGGGIFVIKVTGMTRFGASAVRQYKYAKVLSGAPGQTGTWSSAKLTTNPVIGVLGDTLGAAAGPTSGYIELYDSTQGTPFMRVEIQSRNSGDTSSTMNWTDVAGSTMTGEVLGIELDASTLVNLSTPTFGFTAPDVAQNRSLTFSTAASTFTANTAALSLAAQIAAGALDFNRQVFQIATVNNQAVATFDFIQSDISVGNSISLNPAGATFAANDVQLAIVNQLDVGVLNLVGEPTEQVASTTLNTAAMTFTGQVIAEVRTVDITTAMFDATPQDINPGIVVTLSTAEIIFTANDILVEQAPLGYVLGLTAAAMNFVASSILNGNSTTLSTAAMNDVAYDVQNALTNNLSASTADFTPQNLTVTQAVVQVLLTAAAFDFVPRSMQAAGISSVGDRRRIMVGVGK